MKVNHAMARTSSSAEQDFIDIVINRNVGRPGAVLAILQQAQNNHPRKYLPLETLEYIAGKTGLPLSQIYSVATFYALFNLKPQGRNTISVCRGTACHTRGSRDLYVNLLSKFGSHLSSDDEGEQLSVTTPDGFVTVRTVACFGQCALAPVIEINHAVLGHMNETTLERELEALDRKGVA
jgi:NADH-quinone oxidoreductase subunit E